MSASAYGGYAEDNPFVEAMLRMMEIFGLIDRDAFSSRVPYLPGYGLPSIPGGGFPGVSPMTGLGGVPGMSTVPGMGAVPGMAGFPGAGSMPGAGGFPGAGGVPGNWAGPARYGWGMAPDTRGRLDGAWELDKGGFVIIRGNTARLYLSREQYQDFSIGYDRQFFWWTPLAGGKSARYRYRVREGRMILGDDEGKLLLLRRRR